MGFMRIVRWPSREAHITGGNTCASPRAVVLSMIGVVMSAPGRSVLPFVPASSASTPRARRAIRGLLSGRDGALIYFTVVVA